MSAVDPQTFLRRVTERGGEVLAATSEWEVMRFHTKYGIGIVHKNKRGRMTWNEAAEQAREHITASKAGTIAPVTIKGRARAGVAERLFERDGTDCFFCGGALGEDITVEHLVPIAHGGPSHISNLFLAHEPCNNRAGHMSAPEKIAMRDDLRRAST